jgi:hypothetical protein
MFNRRIILSKDESLDKIATKIINYPLIIKDLRNIQYSQIEFIKSLTLKNYLNDFKQTHELLIDNSNLEKSDDDTCFWYVLFDNSKVKYNLFIIDPVELFHSPYIFRLEKLYNYMRNS